MTLVRLDALELDALLNDAGFSDPERRRQAWAVAMRESRGTPAIIGGPNANGSYDWGLFQINDVHRKDTTNGVDWSRILDGTYNAELVCAWTHGGADWSTWGLGDKGWAGSLKETNYEVWLRVQKAYQEQYDAYPAALAAAIAYRQRPGVRLELLIPGKRDTNVSVYQQALRQFLAKSGYDVVKLNPAGVTGFYGGQTKTMTKTAYRHLANTTRDPSWAKGDLSTPGASLIMRIGLRVLR